MTPGEQALELVLAQEALWGFSQKQVTRKSVRNKAESRADAESHVNYFMIVSIFQR